MLGVLPKNRRPIVRRSNVVGAQMGHRPGGNPKKEREN